MMIYLIQYMTKNKLTEKGREGRNRRITRYRHKLRADAIEAYGSKCSCCGESESRFLTFDHINNDGAEHRRVQRDRRHARRGAAGEVSANAGLPAVC